MSTYTIHGVISEDGEYLYALFMVPGDAKANYCNRSTRMQDWPADGKPSVVDDDCFTMFLQKQQLVADSTLEELFGWTESISVYAAWKDAAEHSAWFLSEEEAMQAGEHILDAGGMVIGRTLYKQKRYPVALPTNITLQRGEKGVYAQLNLRPDLDGDVAGKFYFPDRSCQPVTAGVFKVTSVKDHGTYGFLVGEMVPIECPEEEELARHLVNRLDETADSRIRFMKHPVCGSFVELRERSIYRKSGELDPDYIVKLEGVVQIYNPLPYIYDIREAEELESCSVKDFLCEGYHGCTYDELESETAYPEHLAQFATSMWIQSERSPKFVSKAFEQAERLGLVKLRRFRHIDFVYFDRSRLLHAAVVMNSDDLWSVLDTSRDINQQAAERVTAMIKKGKIRIA